MANSMIVSLFVLAACVSISQAIKCHVGLSSKELTFEIGVRQIECGKTFTRCATTTFIADGKKVFRGYCASTYGPYLCILMKNSAKSMTECNTQICSGDLCNKKVEEASQREKSGKGVKCYTGIEMNLPPIDIATGDVPASVDQCEDQTDTCMSVSFLHEVKDPVQDRVFVRVPTVMRLCKPSYSTCENHCERLSKHITIGDCKATCCKGDMCNPF